MSTYSGHCSSVVVKTADYTLVRTDHVVLADTSGGNVTLTLPASPVDGDHFICQKIHASNSMIIARGGSAVFYDGGVTSITITEAFGSVHLVYEDGSWHRAVVSGVRRHQLNLAIVGTDLAVGSLFHIPVPWLCTAKRLEGITDAGTATYNIEERASIGGAGTDMLTSDQVADATGEITTSFSNAVLAEGNYLTVAISAVSSGPAPTRLEIYLEVEVN